MKTRLVVLGMTSLLALPATATAQLGSRPAEQWAVVLESGRRLQGLEVDEVVRRMRIVEGDVVADVGAGTGVFSVPIGLAVGASGRVLAVEVDAGFLPMIRAKADSAGLGNVEAVLGEFQDPMLPRRDVDVAFFHDVLHHIQDREGYLRTLAGYIAPGGRIVVVDYEASHPLSPHQDEPEMLITLAQVDDWMRGIGFELTETIEMFEEKFYTVYTRRD